MGVNSPQIRLHQSIATTSASTENIPFLTNKSTSVSEAGGLNNDFLIGIAGMSNVSCLVHRSVEDI